MLSSFINDLKAIWYFDNRLPLLLNKTIFRGSSGNLTIYCKNGMEILMDKAAGDQSGARYAITSSMYKQYLSYMVQNIGNTSLVILDLGANVGGFSLLLALEKISIQKLIAVELNPNTFLRLRLNLERNLPLSPDQLFCLNAGVCGDERLLHLTLGSGGMDDNIFGVHRVTPIAGWKYTIAGKTFDSIVEQYCDEQHETIPDIDICKMDIEGAEYEIILGQHSQYLNRCKFLLMEIHPHTTYSEDELIKSIRQKGFEPVQTNNKISENVWLFRNNRI